MAVFAVCSFSQVKHTLGIEKYYFRQSQSFHTDEREEVIAIHNLLLSNCRRAVCSAGKAKNSQYKMSVRSMYGRE